MFRHEIKELKKNYRNLVALDPNPNHKKEYADKIQQLKTITKTFDKDLKEKSPVDEIRSIPDNLTKPTEKELQIQVQVLLKDKMKKAEDLLNLLMTYASDALYKTSLKKFNELNEEVKYSYNYAALAEFVDSLPLPRMVVTRHAELLEVLAALQTDPQQKKIYQEQSWEILEAVNQYDRSKTKQLDDSLVYLSYDHNKCDFNYNKLAQQIRALDQQNQERLQEQKAKKDKLYFTERLTGARAIVKKLYIKLGDLASDPERKKEYYRFSEELSGNLNNKYRPISWGWAWDSQEELDALTKMIPDLKEKITSTEAATSGELTPVEEKQVDLSKLQDLKKILSAKCSLIFETCNKLAYHFPSEASTYKQSALQWRNEQYSTNDSVEELNLKLDSVNRYITTLEVRLRSELKQRYNKAIKHYGALILLDPTKKIEYQEKRQTVRDNITSLDQHNCEQLVKKMDSEIVSLDEKNRELENLVEEKRKQPYKTTISPSVVPVSVFNSAANVPPPLPIGRQSAANVSPPTQPGQPGQPNVGVRGRFRVTNT